MSIVINDTLHIMRMSAGRSTTKYARSKALCLAVWPAQTDHPAKQLINIHQPIIKRSLVNSGRH